MTPPMVCSHERALSLDGRGEGEMLVVETIARIRRDHLVRGVPIERAQALGGDRGLIRSH